MIARGLLVFSLLSTPAAAQDVGVLHGATFTFYSALSSSAELARRSLSPLTALGLRRQATPLRDQPIDLAREKFELYVPAQAPPQGYALLVFVSPWQDATVPPRWLPALDRHAMIFVSAANAGNDADVIDRREPLALLAAYNVMERYKIDPTQVHVAGFSGGSRVALRLALDYPDLFRGALLEAGSDPIDGHLPPPPAELFRRFQEQTRIIYLTGEHDDFHRAEDARSRHSLQAWCVFDTDAETAPRSSHELADAASLNQALDALMRPTPSDPDRLARCRESVDQALNAQLRQVTDLLAGGKQDAARRLLHRIDATYGGLAAPRSLDLSDKIDALH